MPGLVHACRKFTTEWQTKSLGGRHQLLVVKFAEVAEVKVVGDVEVNVNVYVPAVVCVKFVNVAKPLTAVTVVVPPKVPPDTVTVTDAVDVVTVFPKASTTRTTG